jgi:hypothetical protein
MNYPDYIRLVATNYIRDIHKRLETPRLALPPTHLYGSNLKYISRLSHSGTAEAVYGFLGR